MFKNVILSTPTLAIKTGSSALVKHAAFQYLANGVLKVKTAGDAPALSGSIADDYKMVCALYITASGTLSWDYSDAIALADDIKVNEVITQKRQLRGTEGLLVGFVVIINETGSAFTLGTTALDVANSTVYYYNAFWLTKQTETL